MTRSLATIKTTSVELLDDDVTVRIDLTFASVAAADVFFDRFAKGLETGHLRIDAVEGPAAEGAVQ